MVKMSSVAQRSCTSRSTWHSSQKPSRTARVPHLRLSISLLANYHFLMIMRV